MVVMLTDMLQNWLRNKGFLEHPEEGFTQLIAWITDPDHAIWLLPIFLSLVAVPLLYACWKAGMNWLDRRRKKLEELGQDMVSLAVQIRNRQGGFRNPWPGNFADGRGRLEAASIRANSLWIKTPGESVFESEAGLTALLQYLEIVGVHLSQGNSKVGRRRAKELLS